MTRCYSTRHGAGAAEHKHTIAGKLPLILFSLNAEALTVDYTSASARLLFKKIARVDIERRSPLVRRK